MLRRTELSIGYRGLLAAVADTCGWWLLWAGAKGFAIAQTFRVCVTWQIWLWVEEAMAANVLSV